MASTNIHRSSLSHIPGGSSCAEYRIWHDMKRRCLDPRRHCYKNYGGRGITIAPEWVNDFAAFYHYVGPRPSPKHSIDRINNEGHYEPGNVRWAKAKQQCRNTRANHLLEIDGVSQPISAWCEQFSISDKTVRDRLKRGWSAVDALTVEPARLAEASQRGPSRSSVPVSVARCKNCNKEFTPSSDKAIFCADIACQRERWRAAYHARMGRTGQTKADPNWRHYIVRASQKVDKALAALIIDAYRRGESQPSIAARYGLSQSTVSNVVRGKVRAANGMDRMEREDAEA